MKSDILHLALLELGLLEIESKIYEKLLILENINISELSRDFAIDRRKIYTALEKLENIGLLKMGKYGEFELESPSYIAALLQEKEVKTRQIKENLNDLMPQVLSQFYTSKRQPVVKFYEGKAQFINLFNQILESGEEILSFGNQEKYFDLVGFEYFEIWKKKRIQKKIKSRDLTFSDYYTASLSKNDESEFREIRFLPKKYLCDGIYALAGGRFICWNPILPKVIVVEDKVISDLFKANFELIWELCDVKNF